MNKPYSVACDNNRAPILAVIARLFSDCRLVLEIGSGTGQHAVYFAEALPHLAWQPSDFRSNHEGIIAWITDTGTENVLAPVELDVLAESWPSLSADAVFSANTAHIMHWPAVAAMFAGAGRLLPAGRYFVLYGPFSFDNEFTSESNARFDQWLKVQDPGMGIRQFHDLDRLAAASGLRFCERHAMPANNQILCWQKAAQTT